MKHSSSEQVLGNLIDVLQGLATSVKEGNKPTDELVESLKELTEGISSTLQYAMFLKIAINLYDKKGLSIRDIYEAYELTISYEEFEQMFIDVYKGVNEHKAKLENSSRN